MENEERILARNIRAGMAWHGWSQKDLAEKASIGQSTLSRRFQEPGNFTIEELLKLSKALNIDLADLYREKSFIKQTA